MHKIVLSGYNAYLEKNGNKRLYLGTAESYGIEKLQILAQSGWDDLSLITATFHPPNGDAVRVIIGENGVVEVPKEATAVPAPEHDPGMIVFSGVKEGMQRISTNILYIVGEHAGANGAVTDDTPSEWEQLVNTYNSKLDKQQGAENAGKILEIGEDGSIIFGDKNDELPTATDEEIIDMLIEIDMLNVVTDSDDSILSDEEDSILLW